jgi:exodeoxyribonuclease III
MPIFGQNSIAVKILSYNVNGIRAAMKKGLIDFLRAESPDVVCLQEIKATSDQFDTDLFRELGYAHLYFHSAEKKGYSGVAILSKHKPDHVETGCGTSLYDCEGRILRADFGDVSVMSIYMPSGTTGEIRQAFKYKFLDFFFEYIRELRKERKKLVLCGDWNIAHTEIDIHNPKSNAKTSGFLPEERAWLSRFLAEGYIDSFRHFSGELHQYSWWSSRFGARDRNLGWRIDYHIVTDSLKDQLRSASILQQARHSDHCPVVVEVDFP